MYYELRVASFDLYQDMAGRLRKNVDRDACDESGVYTLKGLNGRDFDGLFDEIDLNPTFCEVRRVVSFMQGTCFSFTVLTGNETQNQRKFVLEGIIDPRKGGVFS